jgi:hypothetical protein
MAASHLERSLEHLDGGLDTSTAASHLDSSLDFDSSLEYSLLLVRNWHPLKTGTH